MPFAMFFISCIEAAMQDMKEADITSGCDAHNRFPLRAIARHRRKAAIDVYRYPPENDTVWNAELRQLYNYQSSGRFTNFCVILEQYIKNYKMFPITEG